MVLIYKYNKSTFPEGEGFEEIGTDHKHINENLFCIYNYLITLVSSKFVQIRFSGFFWTLEIGIYIDRLHYIHTNTYSYRQFVKHIFSSTGNPIIDISTIQLKSNFLSITIPSQY